MRYFDNRKKNKFLFVNRLKYGQDKKPVYNARALVNALTDGDEESAEVIVHEMIKQKLKGE